MEVGLDSGEAGPIGCSLTIIGELISPYSDPDTVWVGLLWSVGCSESGVGDRFVGWDLMFVDESEYIFSFGFL